MQDLCLQDVMPDKFCQAKHPEDKNLSIIYGQDMELLMTESHMYLPDIKSSPSLTGQNNNRKMSSIRLNLLTKTTWKLKTPGGILVFRVLMQVWAEELSASGAQEEPLKSTHLVWAGLEQIPVR